MRRRRAFKALHEFVRARREDVVRALAEKTRIPRFCDGDITRKRKLLEKQKWRKRLMKPSPNSRAS